MKKNRKLLFTVTSVLMAFIMCFFTACAKHEPQTPAVGDEPTIQDPVEPSEPIEPPKPDDPTIDIFDEYDLDNVESFVCSLLYTDLRQEYDTFTGYVTLSDTTESYGLCYTDYEEGYSDSNGKTYFSSGFIAFSDEPSIAQEDVNSGLEIHSLEDEDDDFSYVLSYLTEDVHGHCVVYDKYVQYDIINGELSYSEQDYEENMAVDISRGNIYNYDTSEWDYLVEVIDYIPLTGISLVGETDYQKIVDEVNAILARQEANLSYSDLQSYVEQSQEALISYLLGLQEETFMGISTEQLVEIAKELEPLQHIQIVVDAEGNTTLKIIEIEKLPTLWEKIITSYLCACSVVLGTVCNIVGKAVPGLSALGGLLVGVGIEVFSQVVISNTPVSDISWAQVGVAAAAGAISGLINCKLNTSKFFSKSAARVFFREVTDTLCDGIVGGTEFFANSLIAGQSFQDACKNFGYGMIAGVVISGGVKLATAAAKGGTKLVKKAFGNSVSEVGGQPVTKISSDIAEDGVGDLNSKVSKKTVKKVTSDTVEKLSDTPYAKKLKAASPSIRKSDISDVHSIIKQMSSDIELDSHPVTGSKHFSPERGPRSDPRIKADTVFTNVSSEKVVDYVIDDLRYSQICVKEGVHGISKGSGKWLEFVVEIEDAKFLRGKDLISGVEDLCDYRIVFRAAEDTPMKYFIYDIYPIIKT